MTFPRPDRPHRRRPRLSAWLASVAPSAMVVATLATLATLALAATGCEDKHIGRPCDLSVPEPMTTGAGSNATINSQAVECPSRICLSPVNDKNATTGPLCTAGCSSDDDCSDGETSKNAADKTRCHSGFACLVVTSVGDFCCERLCVCKDFVDTSQAGYNKTPEVCKPGTTSCKNVH